MRLMNGSISIGDFSSNLDFFIKKAINISQTKSSNLTPMAKKKKVLITDDDHEGMTLMKLALEEEFEIVCAYTGQEALTSYEGDPEIALILMDGRMPVMDGFEAAKAIKKIRPELPIICISSYEVEPEYGEYFVCHLRKPFSMCKELLPVVKRILQT